MAIAEDIDENGEFIDDESQEAFPSQQHLAENNAKRGKYVGKFVPPKRFNAEDLKQISISEGQLIRQYAKTMDEDEIAFMLGIDFKTLDETSLRFFQTEYTRGQLEARHTAGDALFSAMKKNNTGLQAALEYLQRFGGNDWKPPKDNPQDGARTLNIMVSPPPQENGTSD